MVFTLYIEVNDLTNVRYHTHAYYIGMPLMLEKELHDNVVELTTSRALPALLVRSPRTLFCGTS